MADACAGVDAAQLVGVTTITGNLTIDAVGLTADDLAVLHNLAATMVKSLPEGITRNGAVTDFDEQSKQIGFAGVPVETTLHLNGAALSTTIVKSVDHAPIAPDTFVIPAGYAKRDMPGLTIGQ